MACGIRRNSGRVSQQKRHLNRVWEEDFQSDSQLPGIEIPIRLPQGWKEAVCSPRSHLDGMGSAAAPSRASSVCDVSPLWILACFSSIESFMGDRIERGMVL